MIACARFWNSRRRGIFAAVRQQRHPRPGDDQQKIHASQLLRFYVLRMLLEYDGVWGREHCCLGCMVIHQQTAFSCEELDRKVNLKADFVSCQSQNTIPDHRWKVLPCDKGTYPVWF